jgi:nicotinamide mononucleotide (NMN) deamidase PncC
MLAASHLDDSGMTSMPQLEEMTHGIAHRLQTSFAKKQPAAVEAVTGWLLSKSIIQSATIS